MKTHQSFFLDPFHQCRHKEKKGFTLIETLVTAVVACSILSASLGVINAQRRSFLGDRDRITVNGNLRIAMSLMGDDIKQAGERLESLASDFPAVSVIDGPASGPDRLILQHRKIAETLTICSDVSSGNGTIDVADAKDSPNCAGTGSNPNIAKWQTERCSLTATKTACAGSTDEKLWAYLYDPVARNGEFIRITNAVQGTCVSGGTNCWRFSLDVKPVSFNFTKTVDLATQPKLYVLEQKEYRLSLDTMTDRTDDYVLELIMNGQSSYSSVLPPQRLTNLVGNMQFRARTITSSGTENWLTDFNIPAPGIDPPQFKSPGTNPLIKWQTLGGIEVTLKGLNVQDTTAQLSSAQLTLQSQFLPRNVISTTN